LALSSPCIAKPSYSLYCGIDIAAKTFTAKVCKGDEEPSKALNFKQTAEDFAQLKKFLLAPELPPDQILVVMEATGTYWTLLASYLDHNGFGVSVINPAALHDFAKSLLLKSKNDQLDAQTLARLGRSHKPTRWTPPPAIYRELSQRLSQRADLMEMRQQLKNQLHALSVCEAVPSVVARLELLIETLSQQLKELDKEIKKVVSEEPLWAASVELLETITGIGWLTACWLVTLTLNFTTCEKAESLVHYAGLAPTPRKSGTSVRNRPMIGHGGHGPLRAVLYTLASSAIRFNPVIKAYYLHLRENKGKAYKVARCAAARKLIHLAFAVVTSKQVFDPDYLVHLKAKKLAEGLAVAV